MDFTLTSTAFDYGDRIPDQYTCMGKDTSPDLKWENVPIGTKSLALIIDDLDVPKHLMEDGMWDHCMIYNIQVSVTGFTVGEIKGTTFASNGTKLLNNSWGKKEYGGPCPPPGPNHRYFFKLYALDTVLTLASGADKQDLISAMEGHIVGLAELMGTYSK